MHLFKSSRPNLFHYVTSVTFKRIPIFGQRHYCDLFIDALKESKRDRPYNLVGYVIMPDHFHLLINPLDMDVRKTLNAIKGRSARSILNSIKSADVDGLLTRLQYSARTSRGQTHKVWQTGFSSIDISSEKFIRQKLNYIHMNPVRAGLAVHPAKWRYSSFRAYFPHKPGEVPIEIDSRGYWEKENFD